MPGLECRKPHYKGPEHAGDKERPFLVPLASRAASAGELITIVGNVKRSMYPSLC